MLVVGKEWLVRAGLLWVAEQCRRVGNANN